MMKRSRRNHEKEHPEPEGGWTTTGNEADSDCSVLRLPEACLAHVISLTTPTDACRSSAVSTAFQAAASSDPVWERFLPPDYRSIISRADHPVDLTTSKKELFLSLAEDHILVDQGTKSFWLDRTSGAKCYMLSSRSVHITWGDYPLYWRRIYLPDSRFEEVAELIAVCWLDIAGNIERTELSPNTKYAAYLVFRLADESYGLDCPTQEARIATGDQVATRRLSMYPCTTQAREGEQGGRAEDESTVSYPREREDDWMEVELGEFYNHQGDTGVVGFSLVEHVQLHWKKGLMLEGIEIRQKN
ncbi:F-box protein PP2-B10-like isoform X2 [Miscanthus floridulus]